jgi:hypothetical protein
MKTPNVEFRQSGDRRPILATQKFCCVLLTASASVVEPL